MTVAGSSTLNVDFSKPAGSQPAMYRDRDMPGYRRLAYVPAKPYELDRHLSYLPVVMLRDNCSVTVDGVRRALPGAKAQPARAEPRRGKPSPPEPQPRPMFKIPPSSAFERSG